MGGWLKYSEAPAPRFEPQPMGQGFGGVVFRCWYQFVREGNKLNCLAGFLDRGYHSGVFFIVGNKFLGIIIIIITIRVMIIAPRVPTFVKNKNKKKVPRGSVCVHQSSDIKNGKKREENKVRQKICKTVAFIARLFCFCFLVLYSYLPVFSAPNTPFLFPLL